MLQRYCHMAEKIRRVLHSKECMMTGDVSELAKREGKLYFDAFQGEKKICLEHSCWCFVF